MKEASFHGWTQPIWKTTVSSIFNPIIFSSHSNAKQVSAVQYLREKVQILKKLSLKQGI